LAHIRLTAVWEAATEITFDDNSKIVFFSDCHRGDNSKADAFTRNEELYLSALDYYYQAGFTLIEVGDGDEMWKNSRFSAILTAHRRTFDWLHKFDRQHRLHLIIGNHDIHGNRHSLVEKDGMVAQEGLILRHKKSGQRIFAVHGHQADFKSDGFYIISRLAVRHVWRRVQLLSPEKALRKANAVIKNLHFQPYPDLDNKPLAFRLIVSMMLQAKKNIERRISAWAGANRQIVVCGHTHRPTSAAYGALPYFNTGSCVAPGLITGLEFQHGELTLVEWYARPNGRNGKAPKTERRLMAPPRKLRLLS
jgi:UDP-2,3-diacylglucosamine pyrophosphatase LpxH